MTHYSKMPQPTSCQPHGSVVAAAALLADFVASLGVALDELAEDLRAAGFEVEDLCPDEPYSTSPPGKSETQCSTGPISSTEVSTPPT